MNATELREALLKQFKDIDYKSYLFDSDVIRFISIVCKNEGLLNDNDYLHNRGKGQCIEIQYKDHYLCRINVKKKMGKHHTGYYGGGWNDWTVSDFEVEIYGGTYADEKTRTLADQFKDIREAIAQSKIKAENYLAKVIDAINVLKDTGMTNSDIKEFAKYVNEHRYSINCLN